MTVAPREDEARVSAETYDIYRFLHQYPSIAPARRRVVLRASINYTPFGYIFGGLVSSEAASHIDSRLTSGGKACDGLRRDHFYTWEYTDAFFFSAPLMKPENFWAEMKRRNEVVVLTKAEHSKAAAHQSAAGGLACYSLAGIHLVRVDARAIKCGGQKACLVRRYWPDKSTRESVVTAGAG